MRVNSPDPSKRSWRRYYRFCVCDPQCPARRPGCHIGRRDARLRDNFHSTARCRDRTSRTFHTAYDRSGTDRRAYRRCLPDRGQNQVRAQLAGTLKGIVSQCLIPCGGGTARMAATELLVGTDAILNLVREGKAHQIPAMMQTGSSSDMHTLNMDLSRLVRQGFITRDDAIAYTNNKAEVGQYL